MAYRFGLVLPGFGLWLAKGPLEGFLMTVKQCAEEFRISVALIREMLRLGLLRGEKTAKGWQVDVGSRDVLSRTLGMLREQASPADIELPAGCWDWLYEPVLPQQVIVSQPWRAVTPENAGAWLGRNPPAAPEKPTEAPPPERPKPRPLKSARPFHEPRPTIADGPPCPVCAKPTVQRIIDADVAGWYNYCENCGDWVMESSSKAVPAPGPPGYRAHAADFELPS